MRTIRGLIAQKQLMLRNACRTCRDSRRPQGVPRHPVHARYISSRKIYRGNIDVDFLRRACARRVGADKSLSNCSLKNSAAVAPSRDGARQRPAALKPGPDVLYFARPAGRAGQSGRNGFCALAVVCLLIFTATVDRARRASTVRDAPSKG